MLVSRLLIAGLTTLTPACSIVLAAGFVFQPHDLLLGRCPVLSQQSRCPNNQWAESKLHGSCSTAIGVTADSLIHVCHERPVILHVSHISALEFSNTPYRHLPLLSAALYRCPSVLLASSPEFPSSLLSPHRCWPRHAWLTQLSLTAAHGFCTLPRTTTTGSCTAMLHSRAGPTPCQVSSTLRCTLPGHLLPAKGKDTGLLFLHPAAVVFEGGKLAEVVGPRIPFPGRTNASGAMYLGLKTPVLSEVFTEQGYPPTIYIST